MKAFLSLHLILLTSLAIAIPPSDKYEQCCIMEFEELKSIFKMSYSEAGSAIVGPECLNLSKDVEAANFTKNYPLASISRAYRHKTTGEILERHLMAVLYSKLDESKNKYDYLTDVRASSNNCILNYGDEMKKGRRIIGAHITGRAVETQEECLEIGTKFGPPAAQQSSKEVWLIFEGKFLQTYQ